MIKSVLVLGAGSAGLIAALTFQRKFPHLAVRIVRSPEIGVIGVGEATTPNFPTHMFSVLGISKRQFFAEAQPTWKLGIHFLWGPRPFFNYGFSRQLDSQLVSLPRPNGYYCDDDFTSVDFVNSLMEEKKVYARSPNGGPEITDWYAFHIENVKLVALLEKVARQRGIEIIDARVQGATKGEHGIASVVLEDGTSLSADFFIDTSGFRSELLGRTLEEPFVSFASSLFCDRAVVGNWPRTDEKILPYTTAETMECGWCWQIDHEHHINRGYVYCSSDISDDAAREEFVRKNPKVKAFDRLVKFRAGRYRRSWVQNVAAIGNACGFVEPLESSGLMMVCFQCEALTTCLQHCALAPTPTMRDVYNQTCARTWDEVRGFLSLHYHANTRLDNAFWRRCRNDADVSGIADLLQFYRENGPTGLCRYYLSSQTSGNFFGVEGILVMLVGTKYPYQARHTPTPAEWQIWNDYRSRTRARAGTAMDSAEVLACLRHPNWRWQDEM